VNRVRQRPPKEYWALGGEISGYVLDLYPNEVARYARRRAIAGFRILGRFATPEEADTRVWKHVKAACDRRNRANRRNGKR
jgi:hypothetical protein